MSDKIKQVIVMRTDLNMRKGKMIAQGAHASIAWLTKRLVRSEQGGVLQDITDTDFYLAALRPHEQRWLEDGLCTKICVRVDSEQDLLFIHHRAQEDGITSSLIQDAGLTEFGGVPTYTCCALGPDYAEKIDWITGNMRLL